MQTLQVQQPSVRPAAGLRRPVFGFSPTELTEQQIASQISATVRAGSDGVGLIVTPNIQHVALLRHDQALRRAYANAELVTCDGFPVLYYARIHGYRLRDRVTGRGITDRLMRDVEGLRGHRVCFVLADQSLAFAVAGWALRHGLTSRVRIEVADEDFHGSDQNALADRIREHQTTLLFVAVGVPQSEVFIDKRRHLLPPCWALAVGQAVHIAVGARPKPPRFVEALNEEWLWRIALEPRRLFQRYALSGVGFLLAVWVDWYHRSV